MLTFKKTFDFEFDQILMYRFQHNVFLYFQIQFYVVFLSLLPFFFITIFFNTLVFKNHRAVMRWDLTLSISEEELVTVFYTLSLCLDFKINYRWKHLMS